MIDEFGALVKWYWDGITELRGTVVHHTPHVDWSESESGLRGGDGDMIQCVCSTACYCREGNEDKIRQWTMNRPGLWARTACSFRSAQAATAGIHVPFTNSFVCGWFCVVHDPKPPLHSHNWLSFGKFQDTERFLIHCERHFSSRLPPSGGSWKYAKAPSTKNTWSDSLPIDMLLSAVSVLVVAQSSSEIPEGLMNNPIVENINKRTFDDRVLCLCGLNC